jgi:hypothetical protein
MRDPRTKIQLPHPVSVVLVTIFLALGYGVILRMEQAGGLTAMPTLLLGITCAWCMRSMTEDHRRVFMGDPLYPTAVAHRLPGHIAQFQGTRVRLPMSLLGETMYLEVDEVST